MSRLFGFVQFDFAGTLPLADGRYLARALDEEGGAGDAVGENEEEPSGDQSVLVIGTTGAPAPGRRRRRRPRDLDPDAAQEHLPLTRVTAVRAFEPFTEQHEGARWLDEATEAEDTVDVLVEEGIGLLNRALHAQRTAAGDPYAHDLNAEQAVVVRIGFGSGEQVADGSYEVARRIDMQGGLRRRRGEDLRPQERVAAVLGGRERVDASETLILRARTDLDGGRWREAALQLRVGLEALLVELRGALTDPGHEEDMTVLEERRGEVGRAANAALRGDLDPTTRQNVRELVELCERVLRRRRVLRG